MRISEERLLEVAAMLEPKTHCCECNQRERHAVCIQYPNCECDLNKATCDHRYELIDCISSMYEGKPDVRMYQCSKCGTWYDTEGGKDSNLKEIVLTYVCNDCVQFRMIPSDDPQLDFWYVCRKRIGNRRGVEIAVKHAYSGHCKFIVPKFDNLSDRERRDE